MPNLSNPYLKGNSKLQNMYHKVANSYLKHNASHIYGNSNTYHLKNLNIYYSGLQEANPPP